MDSISDTYLHIGGPHHNTWTTPQPGYTSAKIPTENGIALTNDQTTGITIIWTHLGTCHRHAINIYDRLQRTNKLATPPAVDLDNDTPPPPA